MRLALFFLRRAKESPEFLKRILPRMAEERKVMSKIVIGLLLGAGLGAIDGLCAWLYPQVTDSQMAGIVIGSTFKGLLTGLAAGALARRLHSVPIGVAFGLAVGLILSFVVAWMGDEHGNHYYAEIMLPGTALGGIVGFATQRFGVPGGRSPSLGS